MKKILGISLVAVLAATPLMANAANELASGVQIHGGVTVSNAENGGNALATKSYVQGAYNTVETDIANVNNAVTLLNNNAETAGSVLNAVKTQAANASYAANGEYAEGSIGEAIQNIVSGDGSLGTRVTTLEGNTSFTSEEVAGNAYLTSQTDIAGNVVNVAEAVETLNGTGAGSVTAAVLAETNRATEAEGALDTRLDAIEGTGAGSITYAVAQEASARAAADGDLTTLNTGLSQTDLVSAINSENTRAKQAESDLSGRIDAINTASGSLAADGHYILKANNVSQNLQALDNQAYTNAGNISTNAGNISANAGAIATINNKQIPVVTDWSTGTVSNTKISELVTAQN